MKDLDVTGGIRAPWWLLAVFFYLTEAYVVHLHFRQEAHSFSLSEIPLVIGLYFAGPVGLMAARLLGSGAALITRRRQSPVKVAFNLALFEVETGLTLLIFRALIRNPTVGSLSSWAATFLATLATAGASAILVLGAISLSEGKLESGKAPRTVLLVLVGTATNTSLALVAVIVIVTSRTAGWLLLVPVGTLFLAYRAYTSERLKHERIEFLYQSSRILHDSPEFDASVVALLAHARQMFRAEVAEITLFPPEPGGPCFRTSVGPGDRSQAMVPIELGPAEEALRQAVERSPAFLVGDRRSTFSGPTDRRRTNGEGPDAAPPATSSAATGSTPRIEAGPPIKAPRLERGRADRRHHPTAPSPPLATPEDLGPVVPPSISASEGLAARGIRGAMVAALPGETRIMGVMVAGNRRDAVSTFSREDLMLFETLAGHASVSLENGRLEQSLAELTKLEQKLKHQAYHDSLTGLANRALFTERVEEALQGPRSQNAVAVLFLDLDDFKTINDSLGHLAGDELLIAVAERLRNCLRPGCMAARLGGDEFAVLVPDVGDPQYAVHVARRVSEVLETPFCLQGREVSVRASIGIAAGQVGDRLATDLLCDADVAMYTAKSRGKARYETFEPSMQAAVRERHELKADMEQAFARGEFFLHYQPIVRLATGRIAGVEALVRWSHPQRGLVSPSDFIPLAEETGLILPLGRWVLEQAARQAVTWQATYPGWADLTMSVNLSVRQIQQVHFLSEVTQVLATTGLDPSHLILEITESAMMEDSEATILRLEGLKELGVRLAIDDFGTGYSSLSSLRHLPVDILKLAKPFVDGLARRAEEAAFTEAIVRMADSLRLEVVAEGIETREQLRRLRELGCDLGQGYYVATPMLACDVEDALASLGVECWTSADTGPRAQVIELRRWGSTAGTVV